MRTTVMGAFAGALLLLAAPALAQTPAAAPAAPPAPDFSKTEIKTTDLGHGVYMLQGAGGNITMATAEDGVLMVDTEFAPLHDRIKAAITALSPQPIRYVVNTHYHGDHTGGDAAFAADGAQVIAQANVKTRLAEGTTNALSGAKTAPVTGAALPSRIYKDALIITMKGRVARLKHAPNAHTDGDTYVYFPDADVLATGDIVTIGGRYPNIDVAVGGNIKGMIAGTDAFLALAGPNTKIVPGHGPLLNKAAVQDYRTLLVTAQERVAALIAAGKSEDEAVAAAPLADLDAKAGANAQGSANFVRLIYRSLKP